MFYLFRIVGGTVYPGLMITSGSIHYVLSLLNIPIHIRYLLGSHIKVFRCIGSIVDKPNMRIFCKFLVNGSIAIGVNCYRVFGKTLIFDSRSMTSYPKFSLMASIGGYMNNFRLLSQYLETLNYCRISLNPYPKQKSRFFSETTST